MAKKHESKWNIEELTDLEIYEAIRYLEPDPTSNKGQNDIATVVICVSLLILALGCFGFIWFIV